MPRSVGKKFFRLFMPKRAIFKRERRVCCSFPENFGLRMKLCCGVERSKLESPLLSAPIITERDVSPSNGLFFCCPPHVIWIARASVQLAFWGRVTACHRVGVASQLPLSPPTTSNKMKSIVVPTEQKGYYFMLKSFWLNMKLCLNA